jgi:hypothetical protein
MYPHCTAWFLAFSTTYRVYIYRTLPLFLTFFTSCIKDCTRERCRDRESHGNWSGRCQDYEEIRHPRTFEVLFTMPSLCNNLTWCELITGCLARRQIRHGLTACSETFAAWCRIHNSSCSDSRTLQSFGEGKYRKQRNNCVVGFQFLKLIRVKYTTTSLTGGGVN